MKPVNLKSFGAKLDGTTDDGPAWVAALAQGGDIYIPSGTTRIVATAARPYLAVPEGTTIRGAGQGRTRIVLDSDATGYRECFRLNTDTTLRSLTLARTPAVSGVFVRPATGQNLNLRAVTIDGGTPTSPGYMHGLMLPDHGSVDGLHLAGVTVKCCSYGLLQASSSDATVSRVTVDGCTFAGNTSDDLEFNSPGGTTTDVTVTGSTFSDSGGFGVGLANVYGAEIHGNTFARCRKEFVHIEDRSSDIDVSGNTFTGNVATNVTDWYSFVFVISGSSDVTVSDNTFDPVSQVKPFRCVYVGPGGDYETPMGVAVKGNRAVLRGNVSLVDTNGGAEVAVA